MAITPDQFETGLKLLQRMVMLRNELKTRFEEIEAIPEITFETKLQIKFTVMEIAILWGALNRVCEATLGDGS